MPRKRTALLKGVYHLELLKALKGRRSIRSYKGEPVSEEVLAEVLEAGRIAPSSANRQEYKFVVVKDAGIKKALVPVCRNQTFIADAAFVIVGCTTEPTRRYSFVDVAIALDHMALRAHDLGLGSCWIGAFTEDEVKKLLGIPEYASIVCLLPVGVPAQEGVMKERKSREDLFPVDKWG